MTVIKYDVTESDPEEAMAGGQSDPPKPGLYLCNVQEIESTTSETSGNPMVKVEYRIAEGTHRGYPLFAYYTFGEGFPLRQWDQFLQTFGIATSGKRKGQFKTTDIIGKKQCSIRVKSDKDEDGNYKPKVGSCLPPKEPSEEASDDDADDITLDDEGTDSVADEEIEVGDEEVNDEGVGESNADDLWTTAQIKSMGLDQLKQILSVEYEDETDYRKLETAQKALIKLQAAWVAQNDLTDPDEAAESVADEGDEEIVIEEEGEPDDDEIVIDDDYLTEEQLMEMDPKELVRIAKTDFELKVAGKISKAGLVEKILEAQAAPPF